MLTAFGRVKGRWPCDFSFKPLARTGASSPQGVVRGCLDPGQTLTAVPFATPPRPSLLLILGSWKNVASKPGCRRSVLMISVTSRTFWEERKVRL